jgi:hypothetical protein
VELTDRERLALHEAAHIAAAYLLGRPTGGVRIGPNGGEADVGALRDASRSPLEDVVDELAILSVGRVVTRSPADPPPREGDDDDRQRLVASRVCHSPEEIAALIEFGRARARTLASNTSFIELVERLWPLLDERGELSAQELTIHLNTKENTRNGSTQEAL